MGVLRQLSSTYSLLLELQLYNDKFCKDYMIADTQKFFDDFNASFDSYVVDKFLVLIKKYKLRWVSPWIKRQAIGISQHKKFVWLEVS